MSNKKINLKFPDGSTKQYASGTTGLQIAQEISEFLGRNALGILVDGKILDLTTSLTTDVEEFKILTFKDEEGKEIFRHSSAHLLAQAILRLFPEAQLTIGPVVEEGFYYDIDHPPFKEEDLTKIEEEMKKIVKEKIDVKRHEVTYEEAKKIFSNNKYKIELLEEFEKENPKEKVSYYEQGEFKDLCRGPHVPNTGMLKAIKLTKIAGAYWRADAKNKQLQRIYGISFPDKKELNEYLKKIEEAEKRDHRKIGRELDLYSFHTEAPGMPFFHDKGTYIWNKLVTFMTELLQERDYEMVKTPIILNQNLWKQSGHWEHYKDNMYTTKIDSQDFGVKPMNCPGHLIVYKNKRYSYRELPLKMGEFGLVHRHELSGVLSGLFRVRCFTQDDAHIFCTKEQMKEEVKKLLELIDVVYKTFGFEYQMELSTKPEKAMGDPQLWTLAEDTLKETLLEMKADYKLNEGDGAFYGPKIDFHLKDAIGRTWQCGTIQLDFQMPENFDLTYESQNGGRERVVMIHRAILGSVERFLGVLVEHYAGKFPLWISPEQVRILTIADRHEIYAEKIKEELKQQGIRVTIDNKQETLNKKVRNAQLNQVNYILVVGDKEAEEKTVNIRTRTGDLHGTKNLEDFKKQLLEEIKNKQ
ncbi:threonine--tRNA ligase [Candidatus Woesearchaeota archaeon]|nr:threonine--tRNA ligase [Candidatus Woesearchaeota archaeon]